MNSFSVIYWSSTQDPAHEVVLTNLCQKVVSYSSFSQGLDGLKQNHFDVLLIASNFEKKTVINFLENLKKRHKNLPVIVFSHDYDYREEYLKNGATDCVPSNLFQTEFLRHLFLTVRRNADLIRQKRESSIQYKKLENRIGTIVSNTPIILFMLDLSGVFKMGLGKLWERFKVNRQFVLGQKLTEVYHEYPALVDAYRQALKGKIQSISININDIIFEIILTPVLNHQREVKEILGLAHDVTERARSEMSLLKAKKLAEDASKIKQEFIANMSHEIRTPMNAIVGFTNLLDETELSKIQQDYVNSVKVSGENLMGLINSILDFSTIESGNIRSQQETFDLNHVVNSIEKVLFLKINEKKISFIQKIDKDVPTELIGDANRLYQILSNLSANSLKFTEKGEVGLRVSLVNVTESIATLSFEVHDTGIGIPSHMIHRVFDSFVQVNPESNRKYGGTGLGLSIVKKIVHQLNGSIKLESQLNKGTNITVTLPFEVTNDFVNKNQKQVSRNSDLKLPSGLKILLVEDNVMNQKLVLMIFKRYPVQVDLAENGLEAIKALKTNDYDVLLMDIQMPEMDGIEATKIIRREFGPSKRNTPIIAMTAHAFQEELDKCMMVGMNGHIVKPIEVENVIQVINDSLLTNQEELYDMSYLNDLFEGDQTMINEIVMTFEQEIPILFEDLSRAIEQSNADAVSRLAHKAKSSFKMFGMEKSLKALVKMENDGKKGDLTAVNTLFELVSDHFQKNIKKIKSSTIQ